MAIKKEIQYDEGSKIVLGTVTLPPEQDILATKLLTAMISSLNDAEYKQIVAYEYTGPSVSGTDLWNYIKQIIVACGERGIKIVVVVCSGNSL